MLNGQDTSRAGVLLGRCGFVPDRGAAKLDRELRLEAVLVKLGMKVDEKKKPEQKRG